MFIPLNVVMQDIDEDEAETYGKKAQKVTVELMVNTDSICGFNANDDGNTTLRLSNGEVHEVLIKYRKFIILLEELAKCEQDGDDLLISGNN